MSLQKLLLPFYFLVCSIGFYIPAFSQEQPPKPIKVTVSILQNLNFGKFCYSNTSGKVIIDSDGFRTPSGDIILISSPTFAALYNLEALPGTLITILNGPDAILTGSSGGTLSLKIGNSNPISPFIVTGANTIVTIGGTLTVGVVGANPPGYYSGTFTVTFIQQ